MNYISLINNFWLLSEEHDFRPIDIALYFYLLKVANGLLWKPSFRRNNREIMEKFNISSRHTFNDTRNRLKNAGLIDYETYNGKRFSTYTIIDTCAKNAQVTAQVAAQVAAQVTAQVTAQPYNNKTKTKTKTKEYIKKNHPAETELPLNVETQKKQKANVSSPSMEEVVAICVDKGMSEEDAKNFFYYYDAQGWVTTGGQKIRRIDSMVNRWLTNGKGNNNGGFNNTNSSKKAARNREVIDDIMSRYK
mgnify:CR=1 FL=1